LGGEDLGLTAVNANRFRKLDDGQASPGNPGGSGSYSNVGFIVVAR
jgi:hypothetical protein